MNNLLFMTELELLALAILVIIFSFGLTLFLGWWLSR